MTIDLSTFLSQLVSNPALLITFALTLGVILVNGWTDAPNAIATCVSTGIKPRSADPDGRCVQLFRRACYDEDQRHRRANHLQYG